ncbi:CHC2 zinc finger domain-containing protein [Woeseia oceani]|uniref:DNA primase n=1 Tax=Woeseia oceani TaxID=1548547 RepID=A0A193LJH1_9GAMM|nr:CHC2 zinc finger domain-containing protein [Woeseia oceani]ANO52662.1 DNA primase [Woeseia oceani]
MARIPDDQLDRLKAEVAVERLATSMGVTLKRHGADLLGLCPFHDDREPSLVISPKTNLWHCLGVCQSGGSVIDWVMQAEGVSFRHAAELLLADYQPLAADKRTTAHSTVKKLPTALETDAGDAKLLVQVIDYYHETLKQSPEALAYLEKRGTANSEAIDRFKLGFANRTLGYRLPMKNRKDGAALRGQLQRIGVLRTSGHEHFNGSIVMPVIDDGGNVTEVYGRKINDNLRKGTPMHLYLPGAHAGVWNAAALQASPEIIVCESLIDALTFWCAGFRNVTASYGIEGFTADHLAAFKANGTQRVLIAYDRDQAGEAAAEKLSKRLLTEGIDCYRIHFPKGMDANAYACQVQPATKSLGVVIRSAIWLGNGKAKPITTEAITSDRCTGEAGDDPIPPLVAELESVLDDTDDESIEEPEPEPEVNVPAAVVPAAPQPSVEAEVSDTDIVINLGDRRYRIRGLEKNLSFDVMKINLLVSGHSLGEPAVHVDTLDLYQSRPRAAFVKQAAVELGVTETVIKADLGKLLLKCEALQEERIRALQSPETKTVALSEPETAAALDLLKSPELLDRIAADLTRCGLVGEDANKQIVYLAALSRKLDAPLAVTIQSTSAAGKSALMDAVLAFVPAEDRPQYSAMTGQSLYYMGETDLKHKVLALAEEEGASSASYALKLLQSEGELTIASTGKDAVTGKLETHQYHVEGPVMLMLTTTAIDLDEELLNRCIVLSVDEGRQQTEAIHESQRQRRTLAGLLAKVDRDAIRSLHQNAERLIQSLAVVNPYAKHLTSVADRTRTRRDHDKYLTLIDAIALLHQHQRSIKSIEHGDELIRYVEVPLDDIAAANRLAHEVLGRTLDELPPQTRKLLQLVVTWVAERCIVLAMNRADFRFSRREVREATGWGNTQLKVHLHRLEELEYLLVHRGGRGQSFVYELLYDGDAEQPAPHLSGLIDVAELKRTYDDNRSGPQPNRSAPSRCGVGW